MYEIDTEVDQVDEVIFFFTLEDLFCTIDIFERNGIFKILNYLNIIELYFYCTFFCTKLTITVYFYRN